MKVAEKLKAEAAQQPAEKTAEPEPESLGQTSNKGDLDRHEEQKEPVREKMVTDSASG